MGLQRCALALAKSRAGSNTMQHLANSHALQGISGSRPEERVSLDVMRELLLVRAQGNLAGDVSAAECAAVLGVDKAVVETSLHALSAFALAEQHGRRWHLRHLDSASLAECCAFRAVVEPQGLGDTSDARRLNMIKAQHHAFLRGPADRDAMLQLDMDFHRQFLRMSANSFLIDTLEPQIAMMTLTDGREPAALRQDLAEHLEIVALLESGNRPQARMLLQAHINRQGGVTMTGPGLRNLPFPANTP
jgi:DNA-binding GntR family transcriptional regulator